MPYEDLREFVERLEEENELARIKHEVNPILEMTEIADRVVKAGGKALLFENPKGYDIPVLMNAFGTERRMKMALEVERFEEIGERLLDILRFKPESLFDGLKGLSKVKELASFIPKKVKKGGYFLYHELKKRKIHGIKPGRTKSIKLSTYLVPKDDLKKVVQAFEEILDKYS